MKKFQGKSICKKITIGKIFYFEKQAAQVKREKVEDVTAEQDRFEEAKQEALKQLAVLLAKAKAEAGEAEAAIFEIHMMMMEDQDYCDSIGNIIETQKVCAQYAVAAAAEKFARMFTEMEDEHMQARAADVTDISERIIQILSGGECGLTNMAEPVIVAAGDLAPSETVQMDKSKLLGFVTRHGSLNSHTAILARTMNIPALIDVDIRREWDGKLAVINGYTGEIVIEPDEEYLAKARVQIEQDGKKRQLFKDLKGKATITKSGQKIQLYANIGNVADAGVALQNDAEGIGLFRSEFLYLEADGFPSENDQFLAYKTVAENMAGRKVIIRTLDIGSDKRVDYFQLGEEENPALGYRAIRICLKEPEIFKTQLRAILRASAFGNIAVMFPMIISLEELKQAKEIFRQVKGELDAEAIAYEKLELGVMIETPAAVMISHELAKEVDFFSIGTNDLIQYTLAADRQNPMLDDMIDSHHPAILKMIQMTIENAHKNNIWVGICGELAADLDLTGTFLKMGVDELSVSPNRILAVREKIRQCD